MITHTAKDLATKSVHMTQPGLIKSVLADLNLTKEAISKETPSIGILYLDRVGTPHQDKWNYHPVIGKLNHIAQNMWPNISFYCISMLFTHLNHLLYMNLLSNALAITCLLQKRRL
jgi:hypothetical protein